MECLMRNYFSCYNQRNVYFLDYWNKYGLFSPYTPSEINLMNYVITYNYIL